MADWFRSWHGAPTDPKWVLIAKKSNTVPAVASAIAWALFDHASQASPRGDVSGFDCEVYAAWSGLEHETVSSAVNAMKDRGMIVDGKLSAWARRQPEREDNSAARAKAWREKQRTESNAFKQAPNATERNRTQRDAPDTDTDTDKDLGTSPKSCPKRVRTAYPEDFENFWKAYPTDSNMSKAEAGQAWNRLTAEERKQAIDSLIGFRAYCQSNPDYRPIHAVRYLTKKRFEGHLGTAQTINSQCFVPVGTSEWDRWQEHLKQTRGRGTPTCKGEVDGRLVDGWNFPSRMPPKTPVDICAKAG